MRGWGTQRAAGPSASVTRSGQCRAYLEQLGPGGVTDTAAAVDWAPFQASDFAEAHWVDAKEATARRGPAMCKARVAADG